MPDIICAMCGEPWDAYGARHGGGMTAEQYREFRLGRGCPTRRCHEIRLCHPPAETPRSIPDTMRFLNSLAEATDDDEVDEALGALTDELFDVDAE